MSIDIEFCDKNFKFEMLEGDYVHSVLADNKYYEGQTLKMSSILLNCVSGIILDIGAFVGTHSLYWSMIDNRKVYSFEPNPVAFEYLKKNILLNDIDLVNPINCGMYSTSGTCQIHTPNNKNLAHTIVKEGADLPIKLNTVDEFSSNIDEKISLIKIDVEGLELDVLKGASTTIKTYKPLLLVETNMFDQELSVLQFLIKYDYIPVVAFCNTRTTFFIHKSYENQKILEYFRGEYLINQTFHRLKKIIQHN